MIDGLDGCAVTLFNGCGAEVKRLKEELRYKRTGFNAGKFRTEKVSGIDILKCRESLQIVDRSSGQWFITILRKWNIARQGKPVAFDHFTGKLLVFEARWCWHRQRL